MCGVGPVLRVSKHGRNEPCKDRNLVHYQLWSGMHLVLMHVGA